MNKIIYEDGSYRDNTGTVFYQNDNVFRLIKENFIKDYNFLKDKNIYSNSIKKNFLVNFTEYEQSKANELIYNLESNEKVLKVNKINYISYPYEWCFSQLKDAALHHLNFQIYLIDKNVILRDSSAFNIQFENSKPVFIDIPSISRYIDDQPWNGYKQFCENFLNPLLLYEKKKINFNSYLRGSIDGISVSDLNKILSFWQKIDLKTFFHVFLHNYFITQYTKQSLGKVKFKPKKIPKKNYKAILVQLHNWISSIKNKNKNETVWSDYMDKHTYNTQEFILKVQVVKDFIKKHKPKKLIDFGCNNGKFSELALENGAKFVLGLDFDHDAIEQAYDLSKKKQLNFLPLIYDAINPSTDCGWYESERKGFIKRNKEKKCSLIALAFIHHLVIAKNIPLEKVIQYFLTLTYNGIIEFVPKNDPTVKKMLINRDDIYADYNIENFEKILSSKAIIKNKVKITNSNRIIYEYSTI